MSHGSISYKPFFVRAKVPFACLLVFLLAGLSGNYIADHYKKQVVHPMYDRQVEAATLMRACSLAIRSARRERRLDADPAVDINDTGLIGRDWSPITTTTGNPEAKRTSANPAFAALMVRLFHDAGLDKGDVVAIGASGSFPALALATLSAARVLQLEPLLIYSIGSSSYGANEPFFTFLDMLAVLNKETLLSYTPIAISFGGEGDLGSGLFSSGTPPDYFRIADASGIALIHEKSLEQSMRERMDRYTAAAKGRPVRCFVNIGGASANFGATPASLAVSNGLTMPDKNRRSARGNGMLFHYLNQQVPVIHLLDIRHLALAYELPIDPTPQPAIGIGGVYYRTTLPKKWIALIVAAAFAVLIGGRLYRIGR